ncbi:MAG: hypothetical protein PF503_26335 [Desulfobacula sp.]|jgi:hypothetical protein|nr:hypothetical protein [Desulfobacula sp.]
MAIASEILAFLLFTRDKSAKVNPEMIPKNPPLVILSEKLKFGITRRIPIKTAPAINISVSLSLSLKNKGYRKVTNKGKVEKVTSPIATLEI